MFKGIKDRVHMSMCDLGYSSTHMHLIWAEKNLTDYRKKL